MIDYFGSLTRPHVRSHFQIASVNLAIDHWLDRERDQLPLWFPVGIGSGIGLWQVTGDDGLFPLLILTLSLMLFGVVLGFQRRFARVLTFAAIALLIGFAAIALKSASVAEPILQKVWAGALHGRVEKV
ncbi:MAG: hypothetical protein C0429_07150 [Sphingopyxis sp.]|nr:hypothetical protein [Sphingopyxis sp.]